MSQNPVGLHSLLRGNFTLFIYLFFLSTSFSLITQSHSWSWLYLFVCLGFHSSSSLFIYWLVWVTFYLHALLLVLNGVGHVVA
jgi:hypothetical protein